MFAHFRSRKLVGAFIVGGTLFFAFIGIFTYLPYYLTGAPFRLSTGVVSGVYGVYLAGVIVSPFAGRFARRFPRPAIMAVGMAICVVAISSTLALSSVLGIVGCADRAVRWHVHGAKHRARLCERDCARRKGWRERVVSRLLLWRRIARFCASRLRVAGIWLAWRSRYLRCQPRCWPSRGRPSLSGLSDHENGKPRRREGINKAEN